MLRTWTIRVLLLTTTGVAAAWGARYVSMPLEALVPPAVAWLVTFYAFLGTACAVGVASRRDWPLLVPGVVGALATFVVLVWQWDREEWTRTLMIGVAAAGHYALLRPTAAPAGRVLYAAGLLALLAWAGMLWTRLYRGDGPHLSVGPAAMAACMAVSLVSLVALQVTARTERGTGGRRFGVVACPFCDAPWPGDADACAECGSEVAAVERVRGRGDEAGWVALGMLAASIVLFNTPLRARLTDGEMWWRGFLDIWWGCLACGAAAAALPRGGVIRWVGVLGLLAGIATVIATTVDPEDRRAATLWATMCLAAGFACLLAIDSPPRGGATRVRNAAWFLVAVWAVASWASLLDRRRAPEDWARLLVVINMILSPILLAIVGPAVPLLTRWRRPAGAARPVRLTCPGCAAAFDVAADARGRCPGCRAAVDVRTRENRCACGYLLRRLESGRCPECGGAVAGGVGATA